VAAVTSVTANRITFTSADTAISAIFTANARRKWEDEPDTAETWTDISDTSAFWTDINDETTIWTEAA
jgi:hypothetical protein